jgi:hypothetical protein
MSVLPLDIVVLVTALTTPTPKMPARPILLAAAATANV